MIPKSCRLFGQDHAQNEQRMIPKKPAPAKAGVADFSDKIMRKNQRESRALSVQPYRKTL